jgi:hypothetical protein
MKKLMIAAAIVCAAAMSQAAQATWVNVGNTSGIYDLDGTTTLTSTLAGTYALEVSLMQVAAGGDKAVQTLSGKSAINSMTAGQLASGAAWSYTFDVDATTGDEFYILLSMTKDGKNYEMIIDNNWAIAATDNTGKDTFTWAAGTYGGLGTEGQTGKWVAQSVPEPTSGLLLLLGMAGLALKRKRA